MSTVLLAVLLFTAACGGSNSGSVGEEAPGFNVTTVEGDEFDLVAERGEVVALYFMSAY